MNDIVIIGGGIIGCAIARELSKYELSVILLEKDDDVASGISKANSGIIHAGYNETANTLKARFCIEGNALYDTLARDLDFNFKRNGAFVVAFSEDEVETLNQLKINGDALGVPNLEILTEQALRSLEPNLSSMAIAALHAPSSAIVSPYEVTIALAENACVNGVEFKFNADVKTVRKQEDHFIVELADGSALSSKLVINAAGLNSDDFCNLFTDKPYHITPVKGEYCLFDKIAGKLVNKTIFQVPTPLSKGVLVTPSVEGNLLVGPTAKQVKNKNELFTSLDALTETIDKAKKSIADVPVNRVITTFSGLRPNLDHHSDFIIEDSSNALGFISLLGIESPGLTAAPAIALYVVSLVEKHLKLLPKQSFNGIRKGIIKFSNLTFEEKNRLIKENPAYGKLVCKCELVTEGEIVDAIQRPLGARSVDAVKRKTRAMMGGCQGVGCLLTISKLMSRELNLELSEINKNVPHSPIIGFKEGE